MTKVIAIVSSKGGVGKTTVATNLACRLSALNKSVILCDANLSSPSVSIHLGLDSVPLTLSDVLLKPANSHEALFYHPAGFHLIVPQQYSENIHLDAHNLPQVILHLEGHAEYIIIDAAGGISGEATAACLAADGAIIITDLTSPSLIDAARTMKHAEKNNCTVLGMVINRATTTNQDILEQTATLIGIPLLVTIPEHSRFGKALNKHRPVSLLYPHSALTKPFNELASYVIS